MVSSDFCWRKIKQLEDLSADNLKRRSHYLQFILILGSLIHSVYEDANMVWVLSRFPPWHGGSAVEFVSPSALESLSSLVFPSRLLWIEPIKYPIPRNVVMVEDILVQSDLFTWTEMNWGIISHLGETCLDMVSEHDLKSKRRREDRKDGGS